MHEEAILVATATVQQAVQQKERQREYAAGNTTREEILQAADRIFGEIGYDAASTREIAELSGVNKALIHYHFGNKDGLLACLLDRYYEDLSTQIMASLSNEGDFLSRIHCLLDTYMDFLARNRSFCRIVQREASGGQHTDKIRDHMMPMFAAGRDLISAHFPHLGHGPDSRLLSAEQLMISAYGMIVAWFTYSDLLSSLLHTDPLSPANLSARKQHVILVVDTLIELAGRHNSPAPAHPKRSK